MGIIKNIFDFLRYGPKTEGFDVCSEAMSLKPTSAMEVFQQLNEGTIFDELASRKAKSYEQVCEDRRTARRLEEERENLKKIDEVMVNPDIQKIVETIVNVKDMLEIMPAIKEYAENSLMEETSGLLETGVRYIIKLNGDPLPEPVQKFLKYISIDSECWTIDPLGDHEDNEWGDYYYGAREYSKFAVSINNGRWTVGPELFDYIQNAKTAFDNLDVFDFKVQLISGTHLQEGTYQALWLSLLDKYVSLSLQKYGACVLYDPRQKQFYVMQPERD